MKKSLSQAIAMAALLGGAASAHAVNVDPDGHGQALLYPLYTVENGNYTAFSVTNTTDKYKAVKVRFLEGKNSVEVLDFNLYLSPKDVWTGAVVADDDGETGAKLVSADTSCISAFPDGFPAEGLAFLPYKFGGFDTDNDVRARVGHIEIIEMGDLDPTLELEPGVTIGKAIKHVNGVPGSCAAVHNAWNPGGKWHLEVAAGVNQGTGGLYGTGYVINVDSAWSASYDATALANVFDIQVHAEPGLEAPNLGQALPLAVFKNGEKAVAADGWDAVSAVLMKESIQNDYVVGAGLNAQTSLVVTFPTKHPYVNPTSKAPFTNAWNGNNSCDSVGLKYYDREENEKQGQVNQISPRPPVGKGFELCHETNLVTISGSKVYGGSWVSQDWNLGSQFSEGWLNVDLVNGVPARQIGLEDFDSGDDVVSKGLPAIGFSTVVIENDGYTASGVLNTYAQSYQHKATTSHDILAP